MSKLKNIENKLFSQEYKYTPTFINKLNAIEKAKLQKTQNEETSLLILIVYILLVVFIVIMIVIISQGDKYNKYPEKRQLIGDIKNNDSKNKTFWEKLYYIIFGVLPISVKYKSNTSHLTCVKNGTCNDNTTITTKNTTDKKYDYLNTFNNGKNDNVESTYKKQFDESRKCLISNNKLSNSSDAKYDYLNIDTLD